MVGLDIPIIPRRGQTLVTEPLAPIFQKVMLCARYIAIKHDPKIAQETTDPSLKLGVGLSLEQTDTGNILIGNNREFVGSLIDALLAFLAFFPSLASHRRQRSDFSALGTRYSAFTAGMDTRYSCYPSCHRGSSESGNAGTCVCDSRIPALHVARTRSTRATSPSWHQFQRPGGDDVPVG